MGNIQEGKQTSTRIQLHQESKVCPSNVKIIKTFVFPGSICSVHKRISVLKIFQDGWKKGPPPIVVTILGIANGALEQKWKWYQSSLTENEVEPDYFHGTALKCDISSSKTLCRISNCSICGIANEGFREELISDETFQRFGKGFYLAPHSSKSHDYTHANGVSFRAQLLCDVCPGRKYPLKNTAARPAIRL